MSNVLGLAPTLRTLRHRDNTCQGYYRARNSSTLRQLWGHCDEGFPRSSASFLCGPARAELPSGNSVPPLFGNKEDDGFEQQERHEDTQENLEGHAGRIESNVDSLGKWKL